MEPSRAQLRPHCFWYTGWGQEWRMLIQNKSTAFKLSNPVAGPGETDSSRQSAEKTHSVIPYEVEGHAWVPTWEGTHCLKLSMKMGNHHEAGCLGLSHLCLRVKQLWQQWWRMVGSRGAAMCRPRRLTSESDVHGPDPGGGQESDSTKLLAVGD